MEANNFFFQNFHLEFVTLSHGHHHGGEGRVFDNREYNIFAGNVLAYVKKIFLSYSRDRS